MGLRASRIKKRNIVDIDWNEIVRQHGADVFGVAWRILGHAVDAEDVVQEVFLEAQQLETAHQVRKWSSFLRRIATCRALDRLRRRKPALPIEDSLVAGNAPNPEAVAIGNELEELLRQAITELPEQQAAVFCLRYFEDSSYEQIAGSLNISAAAVSTALHKARTRLKTLLGESEEDQRQ